MTAIKKNDFSEGFLESTEGRKVTIKNLDTNEYARFDGDSSSVLKVQKSLLEENKRTPFYQIWIKPDEENGLKYGRYSHFDKNWYKITIKDLESEPPTYLQLYAKKEKMLEIFEEYGLKPKWAKFTK